MAEINEGGTEGAGSTDAGIVDESTVAGSESSPSTEKATEPAAGEGAAAATESDDDQIEEVEGPDGAKYIPKAAFDARVAKLAAQKNAARDEAVKGLLSELDQNPEFKTQFLEKLGVKAQQEEAAGAAEAEDNQGSPFYDWLEKRMGQQPEYKALYSEMGQAMASEFQAWTQSHVQEAIQKAMAPIMRHIGETQVQSFSKQVQDFDKYKGAVAKLMAKGLDMDQAYKVASYDDLVKKNSASVTNKNRNNLKQTPVTGKVGSNAKVGTNKAGYASLDDALRDSFKEGGWTPKPK